MKAVFLKHSSILFLFVLLFTANSCTESQEKKTQENTLEKEKVTIVEEKVHMLPVFDTIDEMLGMGKVRFGDLDSMIERRFIRVLVPYTHTFYYIDGKNRRGISYELMNDFEKKLNKKLGFHPPKVRVIFLPVSREHIIPLLQKGYGDIGVGGLTVNKEREKEVDFSDPLITGIEHVVVGGVKSTPINTLVDLAGKSIHVHAHSDYYRSLKRISDSLVSIGLPEIDIHLEDPFLDSEDLLEMVNSGVIPYTIMAKQMAEHWQSTLQNLQLYADAVVRKNASVAWAVRNKSPKFMAQLNAFVNHHKKGSLQGNMLYNKYLKGKGQLKNVYSEKAMARLITVENIFKKYANQYQLDWLLLVAQGFQESHLDQSTRSRAGAVGIMQIKPSTAAGKNINIHNVYDVDNNIHASAKYTRFIIDHYFAHKDMDALNKELFALASYNAGPARISGLRKRAEQEGLNPNVWFNNVELVAAKSIGRETVQYISNIYKYYCSYRALVHYGELSHQQILP